MTGIAPDGSPVDVYAALPATGEPELIHAAVPPASEILELGCGTGRVTAGLVALGHAVVAVDDSEEMLGHVTGAETVLASIETLNLRRRFPAVVLASNLINTDDDEQRRAFLDTCRRHVSEDGIVLIQCHDPDFDWKAAAGRTGRLGEVTMSLSDPDIDGELVTAEMTYELQGRRWTHGFRARLLDESQLAASVAANGLRFARWLDRRTGWFVADPC